MDIQSANSANGTNAGNTNSSGNRGSDTTINSDFQTFLTLLTTQLENQDPLNPLDSSEFAVQLATFSSVEQQVKTNDLLRDMVSGLGASGLSQYAGWVGMEARVSAPADFRGSPITLAPDPDPASDAATLVVRDATGREVAREAMPVSSETVLWAGAGPTGAPLSPGLYTFEVESYNQGELTSTKPVDHYALVSEARSVDGSVQIALQGGSVVPATEIKALRQPVEPL
ncbi:flagellar basal body rod modification protein [Alphaproteobacteria bacterium GH1-50]|uniref:Basal-body rod modification protein FlgD n=1 Tax=Kangsaoukella pontilimi TaxID=2691042 RepID=A0A7C9IGQ5_9RHOB|nr:flagellar hook capping FlgD N-terminal domain-containing protein [Kangsaoukella pontilimi]MXQ08189.1 flagellar basal body rod modification protein [Kangsaoukella pontilimi]